MDKQPQTISFKLAKELEKLGFKQSSYFYWLILPVYNTPVLLTYKEYKKSIYETDKCELCPAYQLHEILEILPYSINITAGIDDSLLELFFWKSYGDYKIGYKIADSQFAHEFHSILIIEHNSLTEAAGNLLLWCIENNYVKVEELNSDRI